MPNSIIFSFFLYNGVNKLSISEYIYILKHFIEMIYYFLIILMVIYMYQTSHTD